MAARTEIEAKLKEIIEPYIAEDEMPETIEYDADLTNDLGINSLHVIDIIIDIENEYDIEIEDSELQNMSTLNDVLKVIEAKTK
jgi:acyl carrier protein